MNIEFHYYSLHYLCANAGFTPDEALTIAISSQLVDESLSPWHIERPGALERTQVTQNYMFWDESVARDIYRPFHFMPGDRKVASSFRADGLAGKRAVSADSPLSREILVAALKSGNLFRIGIALHTYADTWAHQNFSGDSEPQNSLEHNSPLPSVGHLQALKNPDDPSLVWEDPRLSPEYRKIRNADRFERAAKMIYRFLCTKNRRGFEDQDFVVGRLKDIWEGSRGSSDSLARAADYIVALDVPPYERHKWAREAGGSFDSVLGMGDDPYKSGYEKRSWLRNAAVKAASSLGVPRGIISATGYAGSLLERWDVAAKTHRALCRELFSLRGIE